MIGKYSELHRSMRIHLIHISFFIVSSASFVSAIFHCVIDHINFPLFSMGLCFFHFDHLGVDWFSLSIIENVMKRVCVMTNIIGANSSMDEKRIRGTWKVIKSLKPVVRVHLCGDFTQISVENEWYERSRTDDRFEYQRVISWNLNTDRLTCCQRIGLKQGQNKSWAYLKVTAVVVVHVRGFAVGGDGRCGHQKLWGPF